MVPLRHRLPARSQPDARGCLALACLIPLTSMATPVAGVAQGLPPITEYTHGMPHVPGPLPMYFEPETGRVFLAVEPDGDPILHMVGLSEGFGWPLDPFVIRSDRAATLLRFQRHTLTVVQRHMFLPAPADFTPLPAIPGSPVDSRYVEEWFPRWRIGGAGTGNRRSSSPLRVFLHHAIPEELRGPIREGLAYWNRVLETAAVPDTIEILDLPPAVDPLDPDIPVVLLWATRREPMSSSASHASDPRTGELLKGVVHIDSHWPLVARNEYRAYRTALAPDAPDEAEYVATRVRWAVAHELGHVLAGLSHPGVRSFPCLADPALPKTASSPVDEGPY